MQWLQRHFHPLFGFPSIIRFSWSTAYRMIDAKAIRVDWYMRHMKRASGAHTACTDRRARSLGGYRSLRPPESVAKPEDDEPVDEAVAKTPSVLTFFKRTAPGDAATAVPPAPPAKRARPSLFDTIGLTPAVEL